MDIANSLALLAGGALGLLFVLAAGWAKKPTRPGGRHRDDVSRETSTVAWATPDRAGWCLSHPDGPVWHDTPKECTR